MDFTNFLLLAVERSMVSNKFGLEIFYTAFKEAVDNRNIEQEVIEGEPQSQKDLTRNNFFLAITMLAQALYADQEKPFDAMYCQMLVDKVMTHDSRLIGGRTPRKNEETEDILKESSVKMFLIYIDQLKQLFTKYHHENFNASLAQKDRVRSW